MNQIFSLLITTGKATLTLNGDVKSLQASDLFDDACELAARSNVSEIVVDLENVHTVHPMIVLVLFTLKDEIERMNKAFQIQLRSSLQFAGAQCTDSSEDLLPLPVVTKQNSTNPGVINYV